MVIIGCKSNRVYRDIIVWFFFVLLRCTYVFVIFDVWMPFRWGRNNNRTFFNGAGFIREFSIKRDMNLAFQRNAIFITMRHLATLFYARDAFVFLLKAEPLDWDIIVRAFSRLAVIPYLFAPLKLVGYSNWSLTVTRGKPLLLGNWTDERSPLNKCTDARICCPFGGLR